MSDRYGALTVCLDDDFREEDMAKIVQAIEMVKHVQSIALHVTDVSHFMAESRAREWYRTKLIALLREEETP
ncbi:unnamed protein product [marine sediment metagenome]|uniref:Uncharacterized protein n=1 Tax=marine sediment metagenome TaxID=412755 RepID=X0V8T4_9ZZZZ